MLGELHVGGTTPAEEECAQVGDDDYPQRSRAEGLVFIHQLRRAFGDEPEGATLRVKAEQHDFGTYRSVVVAYEEDRQAAVEYAHRVEATAPGEWDDEARKELAEAGYALRR